MNESAIITAIRSTAAKTPDKVALTESRSEKSINYIGLTGRIDELAELFKTKQIKCLGLYAPDGIEWALIDLAAIAAGVTLIPLPLFFSDEQLLNTINDSAMDAIVTDRPCDFFGPLGFTDGLAFVETLTIYQRTVESKDLVRFSKITYTSGSTGSPKGVCLTQDHIDEVVKTLSESLEITCNDIFLGLLPMSVLLENISGLYLPLVNGATSHLHSNGTTLHYTGESIYAILNTNTTTITLLMPQAVEELADYILLSGCESPESLRFIGCGGGPVSTRALRTACRVGLPVFQGYGLSEAASVIAVNTTLNNKLGSVGKPLANRNVSIIDGEICVKCNHPTYYLSDPNTPVTQPVLHTGDLGCIDAEGYLTILGRKKNLIILSNGRNVSPEWVKSIIMQCVSVTDCMVVGNNLPQLKAHITTEQRLNRNDKQQFLTAINRNLPAYAQLDEIIIKNVKTDELCQSYSTEMYAECSTYF